MVPVRRRGRRTLTFTAQARTRRTLSGIRLCERAPEWHPPVKTQAYGSKYVALHHIFIRG